MMQGILLVASGFVLGNKDAQRILNNMVTKGIQTGIDTLNKVPTNNVVTPKVEPVEKVQK